MSANDPKRTSGSSRLLAGATTGRVIVLKWMPAAAASLAIVIQLAGSIASEIHGELERPTLKAVAL
jgi:hypothetical protein